MSAPVKTAVVTGGHGFDFVKFHNLFHGLDGVEPYVQHMDDFASAKEDVRASYDTVVFYAMFKEGPNDAGQPWYAGRPGAVLERLGETQQGILILHHAILAYPEWPLWGELIGMRDRSFDYYVDQSLHIEITNAHHPITSGMSAWDMTDETYAMADPVDVDDVLLSVDHPQSMRTIAWTRQHRESRVFCFQSGHDNQTWENPAFQKILRRGIHWTAGRI